MSKQMRKHPTIAACGIDCGLCPRYYTKGSSRCPGCGGPNFSSKHPSCPILTCCVKKHKLEFCAECPEFICPKLSVWDKGDSFVTHKVCLSNLRTIKKRGLKPFLKQQKVRIHLLEKFLADFDEGRSKSFYCLACALLTVANLKKAFKVSQQRIKKEGVDKSDLKLKSQILKEELERFAKKQGVELKLRK